MNLKLKTRKYIIKTTILVLIISIILYLCILTINAATPVNFTIVAIPDSQYYTSQSKGGDISIYQKQINWICNQPDLNIKLATHLGDVVDKGTDKNALTRASEAMKPLISSSSIAMGVIPGNHEGYNLVYIYSKSNLKYFNQYFPVTSFNKKSYFVDSFPAETMNNCAVKFSVNETNYINVCLGFNPDTNAKNWANSILDKYPDYRAIISTHDYMSKSGISANGQGIWNSIVKNHANIFLVLCGHNTRENMITSKNAAGKQVYQIMSDYQNDAKGGNGWLRYYKFIPSQNKIEAYTYSPLLGTYESDSNSRFDLAYTMQ
jgi:hypothetical protein